MEERWAVKLENRRQALGETVEQYVASLQELFCRLNDQYPARVQVRVFLSGLRPELSVAVSLLMPENLIAAINLAKGYEMAYSRGGPLSAYSLQTYSTPFMYAPHASADYYGQYNPQLMNSTSAFVHNVINPTFNPSQYTTNAINQFSPTTASSTAAMNT